MEGLGKWKDEIPLGLMNAGAGRIYFMNFRGTLVIASLALSTGSIALAADSGPVDVTAYPSLQAAIDANPGRIIQIPPGEYTISRALHITRDDTELYGPARIIQTNENEPLMRIDGAKRVRIAELSFTRSAGHQEAKQAGIDIGHCEDVQLSHLRISENHTHSTIRATASQDITVADCTIINYKGPTIDDRTNPRHLSGYAFKSIDGTCIQFLGVQGGVIRDNRLQEFRLLPTPETQKKYDLGALTIVPKVRGRLMSQEIFDTHFTNNWHQGAAIQVSSPMEARRVIISGNYIEHPAQGIDLHCDNVSVTNNVITHAMIGMKAMHGAKHVLIDGNQFMYCDLWGVLLMPGAASHAARNAEANHPAVAENVDGGSIISNNIFSYFGFGDQYWNWAREKPGSHGGRNPIAIRAGQLEENPSIHDVLITDNVVYDSGQDTVLLDGKWVKAPPRYYYALYVDQAKPASPINVQVYGNLFDPGLDGVSNYPVAPAPGT